ncbi:MAG: GspE/PulE family protein [Patescibacteria group bacterium]
MEANQAQSIDLLLEKGFLTPEQASALKQEAEKTGADIFSLLAKDQILTPEKIVEARSAMGDTPYIDLSDKKIELNVLEIIPHEIAETYRLCPFKKDGEQVSVAMVNPGDYKSIETLDFISHQKNFKFKYYITSETSLKSVLRQYENMTQEVEKALLSQEEELLPEDKKFLGDEKPEEEFVKTAPVSKMVSVILRDAIEGGASDIHIEPIGDNTRVRFRLDGVLHTSLLLPKRVHTQIVARIKVLANMKLDETRMPQDGRFKIKFENRDIEFRVSTLPLLENEKVVMRILDTSKGKTDLTELGFSDHNLEVIEKAIKSPHGMILVTGPTGSGKSTTLYSLISMLNKEGINIVTLEDPVEYNVPGVGQAQIRPEVGLTFATGLRSILRQDPDIIMVGEIRDSETAELAVHAALTGHMVLSTLHTNDAFGAIPRLVDMKVEPFLISSSLNMVIAQRLIRKICTDCKQEMEIPENMKEEIVRELQSIPESSLPSDIDINGPLKIWKGKGCSHCDHTGYQGRVAIIEALLITEQMEQIVAEGKSGDLSLVEEEFKKQGMLTLKQDGIIKGLRGITSIEEVFSSTKE